MTKADRLGFAFVVAIVSATPDLGHFAEGTFGPALLIRHRLIEVNLSPRIVDNLNQYLLIVRLIPALSLHFCIRYLLKVAKVRDQALRYLQLHLLVNEPANIHDFFFVD